MKKKLLLSIVTLLMVIGLTGCAEMESDLNDLKGSITGNTYTCEFFTNSGVKTMTTYGTNIDLSENVVKERTYNSEDGWGYTETLSSVVTITIDGCEMETCGDTVIFAESGLKPDVDFMVQDIYSEAEGFSDNVFIAKT